MVGSAFLSGIDTMEIPKRKEMKSNGVVLEAHVTDVEHILLLSFFFPKVNATLSSKIAPIMALEIRNARQDGLK